MQVLISNAKNYGIEIIDNKMYLYSNSKFKLNIKGELKEIFKIMNPVQKELTEQTYYYRDEKIDTVENDDVINNQGRRLDRIILGIFCTISNYSRYHVNHCNICCRYRGVLLR